MSTPEHSQSDERRTAMRSAIGSGVILIVLIAATVLGALLFGEEQLEQVIDKLQGPWQRWALLILVIGGVLMAFGFPGTVISVGAGVLYGFLGGTAIALIIVFAAASATYAMARYLGRATAPPATGKISWMTTFRESIRRSDWRFVALLRLTPILPFGLINFGLGKARVGWPAFLLGTGLGIVPGTAAHVYLGSASARWLHGDSLHPAEWGLIVLAVVSIPLTGYLLTRNILAQRRDETATQSEADDTAAPLSEPIPIQ